MRTFASIDPSFLTTRPLSGAAFNPILSDFRRLDGDVHWWAEDCGSALNGEADTGTGAFADILDSLGAWDADEDAPIPEHTLTAFQLDCLAHAKLVLSRLARASA